MRFRWNRMGGTLLSLLLLLPPSPLAWGVTSSPSLSHPPSPDAPSPTPPSAPPPIGANPSDPLSGGVPPALAEYLAWGGVKPNVTRALLLYAQRTGTPILPDPPLPSCPEGPSPLSKALEIFSRGRVSAEELKSAKSRSSNLPYELQCSLSILLLSIVESSLLQTQALGGLTDEEIAALDSGTLSPPTQALLLSKTNPALTLQAARHLDRAIREVSPTLKKWGLLAQIGSAKGGKPVSPDFLLGSLWALRGGDPEEALRFVQGLEGYDLDATLPVDLSVLDRSSPSLSEAILVLYSMLGVPLDPGKALAVSMADALPSDLRSSAARTLFAVDLAHALWVASATDPLRPEDLDRASYLALEVQRIASSPGATENDLALLTEFRDLLYRSKDPLLAYAAAILVHVSKEISQSPPPAPSGPWFAAYTTSSTRRCADLPVTGSRDPTVLGVTIYCRSFDNGTSSVWIDTNGDGNPEIGPIYTPTNVLHVETDSNTCRILVWRDSNTNGTRDNDRFPTEGGRATPSSTVPGLTPPDGETIFDTGRMCDPENDVLYVDPYGYVILTGTGSSTLDSRYGAVALHGTQVSYAVDYFGLFVRSPTISPLWQQLQRDVLFPLIGYANGTQPFPRIGNANGNRPGEGPPSPTSFLCEDARQSGHTNISLFTFGSLDPILDLGAPCRPITDPETLLERYVRPPTERAMIINPDHYQYLTLDLGGDDTYRNNAGGTFDSSWMTSEAGPQEAGLSYVENGWPWRICQNPTAGPFDPNVRPKGYEEKRACLRTDGSPWRTPVALAIDLSGNDRYLSSRPFSLGSAQGGVGVLFDSSGDDTYSGSTDSIASATAATLVADPYGCSFDTSTKKCRSIAFLRLPAVGVLVDLSGNDNYSVETKGMAFGNHTFDQGVHTPWNRPSDWYANPKKNDRPLGAECNNATLPTRDSRTIPSLTTTPYYGCLGPGGLPAPGGIALLFDRSGNDKYSGGNFTGGAGDHSGVGLLLDLEGDDSYFPRALLYGRSFGSGYRTGSGILLDLAGTDSGIPSNGGFNADNYISARFRFFAIGWNQAGDTFQGRGASVALDLDLLFLKQGWSPSGDRGVMGLPGFHLDFTTLPTFDPTMTSYTGKDTPVFSADLPGLFAVDDGGGTRWTLPYSVQVDLGGNDLYLDFPGRAIVNASAITRYWTDSTGRLTSPDIAGNTTGNISRTQRIGTPSTRMEYTSPVALSLDLGGSDLYDATRGPTPSVPSTATKEKNGLPRMFGKLSFGGRALGYGYAGIGALYDLGVEPDVYKIGQRGLGMGEALGVGIFYEDGGDDSYDATVGHTLHRPTSDPPWEVNRSLALGAARSMGLGVFVDRFGDDTYRALNVSLGAIVQRTGREFGIFLEGGGRDTYRFSPMSLGYLDVDTSDPDRGAASNDTTYFPAPPIAGVPNPGPSCGGNPGILEGSLGEKGGKPSFFWCNKGDYGIFLDLGFDSDTYSPNPETFERKGGAPKYLTVGGVSPKNDFSWRSNATLRDKDNDKRDFNLTLTDTLMVGNTSGEDTLVRTNGGIGIDNLDSYINRLSYQLFQGGSPLDFRFRICVNTLNSLLRHCTPHSSQEVTQYIASLPEVPLLRSILLSPGVLNFTSSSCGTWDLLSCGSTQRTTYNVSGTAEFSFGVSWGAPSVVQNLKVLLSLLLESETRRLTCGYVPGSSQSPWATPAHCSLLPPPPTVQTPQLPTPSEARDALFFLEVREALRSIPGFLNLDSPLLEASGMALGGDLEGAVRRVLTSLPTTSSSTSVPDLLSGGDSRALRSMEILLCTKSPCFDRGNSFRVGGWDPSKERRSVEPVGGLGPCTRNLDEPNLTVCGPDSSPRYFLRIDTTKTSQGFPLVPDGKYLLFVLVHFKSTLSPTGTTLVDPLTQSLLSDNYGYWPGILPAYIRVDNRPSLLPTTDILDFNPNLRPSILAFLNFTEPVRIEGTLSRSGTTVATFSCDGTIGPCTTDRSELWNPSYDPAWAPFGSILCTSSTCYRWYNLTVRLNLPSGLDPGRYTLSLKLWDLGHSGESDPRTLESRIVVGDLTPPTILLGPLPTWVNSSTTPLVRAALDNATLKLTQGLLKTTSPEYVSTVVAYRDGWSRLNTSMNKAQPESNWSIRTGLLRMTFSPDLSDSCDGCRSKIREWRVTIDERDEATGRAERSWSLALRCPESCMGPEGSPTLPFVGETGRSYTVKVRAIDNALNVQPDPLPTATVLFDTIPPRTQVSTDPPGRTRIGSNLTLRLVYTLSQGNDPAFDPGTKAPKVFFNVSWGPLPNSTTLRWTKLPETFVRPPTRGVDGSLKGTILFSGKDLGALVPSPLFVQGANVTLLVLGEDEAGNLEGRTLDPKEAAVQTPLGFNRKVPERPFLVDTLPPALSGPPSVTVEFDSATILWGFLKPATSTFEYRKGEGNDTFVSIPATPLSPSLSQVVLKNLSQNTLYLYRIRAVDEVGNEFVSPTFNFTTNPVFRLLVTEPEAGSSFRDSVRLAWKATNVVIPPGKSRVLLDYEVRVVVTGNSTKEFTVALLPSSPESASGNVEHTVTLSSPFRDLAGGKIPDGKNVFFRVCARGPLNPTSPVCMTSPSFSIDTTPPTTRVTLVGPHVGSWYRSEVRVLFEPEDAVSSVRTTYWSLVNKSTEFKEYTGDLGFGYEGPYTLFYYSVDSLGNTEGIRSTTFFIDRTLPTGSLLLGTGEETTSDREILLTIQASDVPSGLGSIVVSTPQGSSQSIPGERLRGGLLTIPWVLPPGDGEKSVEALLVDRAGNTQLLRSSIRLDTSPPVVDALDVDAVGYSFVRLTFTTDEEARSRLLVKRPQDVGYLAPVEEGEFRVGHSLTVSGLLPQTTYVVRLEVEDRLGNVGVRFLNVTTLADLTPPSGIENLRYVDDGTGILLLTWTPASDNVGVERYAVYRGEKDLPSTLLDYVLSPRFVDDTVVPGKEYVYSVLAIDGGGNRGPLSAPLVARSTTRPTLEGGGVDPPSGSSAQTFTFKVRFRDSDGDLPLFVRLVLNGKSVEMTRAETALGSSREGIVYTYSTRLSETRLSLGFNTFHFEASDGKNRVRFPDRGELVGPAVLGSYSAPSEGGLFAKVQEVPLAPLGVLLGVLLVVALGIRRRWKGE